MRSVDDPALRGALQGDDREMLPAGAVVDAEVDGDAGAATVAAIERKLAA